MLGSQINLLLFCLSIGFSVFYVVRLQYQRPALKSKQRYMQRRQNKNLNNVKSPPQSQKRKKKVTNKKARKKKTKKRIKSETTVLEDSPETVEDIIQEPEKVIEPVAEIQPEAKHIEKTVKTPPVERQPREKDKVSVKKEDVRESQHRSKQLNNNTETSKEPTTTFQPTIHVIENDPKDVTVVHSSIETEPIPLVPERTPKSSNTKKKGHQNNHRNNNKKHNNNNNNHHNKRTRKKKVAVKPLVVPEKTKKNEPEQRPGPPKPETPPVAEQSEQQQPSRAVLTPESPTEIDGTNSDKKKTESGSLGPAIEKMSNPVEIEDLVTAENTVSYDAQLDFLKEVTMSKPNNNNSNNEKLNRSLSESCIALKSKNNKRRPPLVSKMTMYNEQSLRTSPTSSPSMNDKRMDESSSSQSASESRSTTTTPSHESSDSSNSCGATSLASDSFGESEDTSTAAQTSVGEAETDDSTIAAAPLTHSKSLPNHHQSYQQNNHNNYNNSPHSYNHNSHHNHHNNFKRSSSNRSLNNNHNSHRHNNHYNNYHKPNSFNGTPEHYNNNFNNHNNNNYYSNNNRHNRRNKKRKPKRNKMTRSYSYTHDKGSNNINNHHHHSSRDYNNNNSERMNNNNHTNNQNNNNNSNSSSNNNINAQPPPMHQQQVQPPFHQINNNNHHIPPPHGGPPLSGGGPPGSMNNPHLPRHPSHPQFVQPFQQIPQPHQQLQPMISFPPVQVFPNINMPTNMEGMETNLHPIQVSPESPLPPGSIQQPREMTPTMMHHIINVNQNMQPIVFPTENLQHLQNQPLPQHLHSPIPVLMNQNEKNWMNAMLQQQQQQFPPGILMQQFPMSPHLISPGQAVPMYYPQHQPIVSMIPEENS